MRPRPIALVACMLAMATSASAAPASAATGLAPRPKETPRYALFRLDPLGIDPAIADQLEHILRAELSAVVKQALPTHAQVAMLTARHSRLAGCTANPACLAPLARALGVDRIVAGNVGGLADSYVVNLKLVDAHGQELRRVVATLRGSPEELIDGVRVAVYRLVAPERVVGSLQILSDVPRATVELDGHPVGLTPLAGPLLGVSAGVHHVSVAKKGFSSFEEDVPIRFEKTTQVLVRQTRMADSRPAYERWYFWVAMAVATAATGVAIGFAIPKQSEVDCRTVKGCP